MTTGTVVAPAHDHRDGGRSSRNRSEGMKTETEKRKPEGLLDYLSLAITTFGVGYLPLAPGTWGSMVGIGIYLLVDAAYASLQICDLGFLCGPLQAHINALLLVGLLLFILAGIRAAGRAIELLGNTDPPEAVVDEVLGQLIVFLFVPFGIGWPLILAGFLLFRLFDIWKPYPINELQALNGGLGICVDDIAAGMYAGVCLAVIHALSLSI
jgi:phosphatidylglycerophosphatase A